MSDISVAVTTNAVGAVASGVDAGVGVGVGEGMAVRLREASVAGAEGAQPTRVSRMAVPVATSAARRLLI
jgi:hypothetical protein